MKPKSETAKCPYYKNPSCSLVNPHEPCEAEPSTPETCTDFVYRKELYGVK